MVHWAGGWSGLRLSRRHGAVPDQSQGQPSAKDSSSEPRQTAPAHPVPTDVDRAVEAEPHGPSGWQQDHRMRPCLSFRDSALEAAYQQQASQSLLSLDSTVSLLNAVLWLVFYLKQQHWELCLAERALFWVTWAANCAVALTAARWRALFVRHRTLFLVGLRVLGCINLVALGGREVLTQPEGASCSLLRFGIRAVFASKAFPLCVATIGRQLPFRHHLSTGVPLLASALVANWDSCAEISSHAGPETLRAIGSLVRRMSWAAARVLAVAGGSPTALRLPASAQGQCWLLHCFLAAVLGLLLPSAALYRRERVARCRFLAALGGAQVTTQACGARPLDLPNAAFITASVLTALWATLALAAAALEERPWQ